MKKLICIFGWVFLSLLTHAQNVFDEERHPEDAERMSQRDSTEKKDVPHHRQTWQWMHNGVYKQELAPDTLLDGIHNYNYIFKKNISNTYLGNFPSPYESNIFLTRESTEDFYPLTNIRAFLFKAEDMIHFNTTTPFTRLKYFTGGGKGKAENLLDVWHVQNIRPWWSAGVRYNLISSDGRYMSQKSKAYNFSVFSTYERERTTISFFLNQNNGHFTENGGIKDRTDITDTTYNAELIPVGLAVDNAYNDYRNTNFQLQGQYSIGKPKAIATETDTLYSYPAKVVLNFRAEGNEHWYRENSANLDFYPNTFLDSTGSYDHIGNQIYDISSKLVVNEHPKYKYLPGTYVGLDYHQENYRQKAGYDSISPTGYFKRTHCTGTYITAGIFNVDTNALVHYDVAGRLCLLGHYVGNFKVDGYITQLLRKDKSSFLKADASIELKSVNPFFDHYVGNHNIWENDFKAIKTIQAQGRYVNTRLRMNLGIGINNIYSYVYLDTAATPQQTSKTLLILTAWANENFRLGNFYFDQHVCFQHSNHEDILSLPTVSIYSHNYYQNYLFKRALFLQIGIDLFYNTRFYADNYMPSIMQFFNQRDYKIGNYPKADVFLNIRIKRADIFVKYEHVNYHLKRKGNYFSASDYPINPGMLKFGVKWDFFD